MKNLIELPFSEQETCSPFDYLLTESCVGHRSVGSKKAA